jgi:phosphoribosyl-AMP cyclohydrolase / phosphoribosyl-ATP pyrophosphohydrolase
MNVETPRDLDRLDFDRTGGLVPVVAQHAGTGEVLMLAYASREALEQTLADRVMWYHSRSRDTLWRKGETSGNTQHLVSLHADCDADAVVALVRPDGPSCHTGDWSCFGALPAIAALDATIRHRSRTDSPGSYTRRLLEDGNLRLKKLGEEAVELAVACQREDPAAVAEEAADLIYHALVACAAAGVDAGAVLAELDGRLNR